MMYLKCFLFLEVLGNFKYLVFIQSISLKSSEIEDTEDTEDEDGDYLFRKF